MIQYIDNSQCRDTFCFVIQIEALKASHPADAPRLTSFDEAMAMVRGNMQWMEQNYGAVKAWLQNYV